LIWPSGIVSHLNPGSPLRQESASAKVESSRKNGGDSTIILRQKLYFLWGSVDMRWSRIISVGTSFLFGQGALQGVNILAALLLVRVLSIEHYAQFSLAFGFHATASLLMDMGYASTIIPLVGERVNDRACVGSYLRAAKHLRDNVFWILSPLVAIAFLAIVHKHHWGWATQTVLLLSVLLGLYSSGPVSYYSAPLFLYGRLREFYVPQSLVGVFRLVAYIVLQIVGGLNACTAAGLNALNMMFNAILLRKKARLYVEWPKINEPQVNREVLNYILPAIPTFIFAAFQSQIALFLINAFGQTINVAEVAALNRVGQLFVVLTTFNLIVIEPRIARLKREKLSRTYLQLVLLACGFGVLVVLLAFAFPAPLLWLIGPKYSDLGYIIGWVVLTACLNYMANLIWIMNRARRWIFWRGTILEIVAMLSVDICFVAFFGIRDTRHAILFTLASSISAVCTHSYIGVYGFLKGDSSLTAKTSSILKPLHSETEPTL
jgi:O-antigen/teichoic acid export membrane protein